MRFRWKSRRANAAGPRAATPRLRTGGRCHRGDHHRFVCSARRAASVAHRQSCRPAAPHGSSGCAPRRNSVPGGRALSYPMSTLEQLVRQIVKRRASVPFRLMGMTPISSRRQVAPEMDLPALASTVSTNGTGRSSSHSILSINDSAGITPRPSSATRRLARP